MTGALALLSPCHGALSAGVTGSTPPRSGIVVSSGQLHVERSRFDGHGGGSDSGGSDSDGSVLDIRGGAVALSDCSFANHTATAESGGAITILAGMLSALRCDFHSNTAEFGGAVYVGGGVVAMTRCLFAGAAGERPGQTHPTAPCGRGA